MPRAPKARLSYQADHGFMIRLSQAVERDPIQTTNWKREVLTHLARLSQLFNEAELNRLRGHDGNEA